MDEKERVKHAPLHGPSCSGDKALDCSKIDRISVNVLRPGDEGHFGKGKAHYDNGRLDEAAGEFKLAIAASPDNTEARLLLGDIYERRGMYDEAIREYEEVIRLDPEDKLTLFKYVTALDQKNRCMR